MRWSLQAAPTLTAQQFAQWCNLLEQRTGIQLKVQQQSLLQTQLAIRMRELNCPDVGEYYRRVRVGVEGNIEWGLLVNGITVNETRFFRHQASFDFVTAWLALRNQQGAGQQQANIDIWSMGCASGEEAYSLAMTLENFKAGGGLPFYYGITATDICKSAIAEAEKAEFSARALETVSPENRALYFDRAGKDFRVKQAISERICFTCDNVLAIAEMPVGLMDIIFCQNMLIYFQSWRREEILDALAGHLKPGGVLVIGLGEVIDWRNPLVERCEDRQVQAYRRVA